MTDVVALAAELLAIDSSTGAESGAIDFVARWLIARGWNVNLQEVTRGRANVWATRGGRGVTLSTHLDTVPPYLPPRLQGDRLTGRTKKIQDVFVDAKVPRSARDAWPIVVFGNEVVAVPGLAAAPGWEDTVRAWKDCGT